MQQDIACKMQQYRIKPGLSAVYNSLEIVPYSLFFSPVTSKWHKSEEILMTHQYFLGFSV